MKKLLTFLSIIIANTSFAGDGLGGKIAVLNHTDQALHVKFLGNQNISENETLIEAGNAYMYSYSWGVVYTSVLISGTTNSYYNHLVVPTKSKRISKVKLTNDETGAIISTVVIPEQDGGSADH